MRAEAAVAVVLVFAPAVAAGRGDCPVRLEGEGPWISKLMQALKVRGVVLSEGDGETCLDLSARASPSGDHLELSVVDGQGRRTRRDVSTTTIAAVLIESWTRSDLTAALLEAPTPPIPRSPRPVVVAAKSPSPGEAPAAPLAPPPAAHPAAEAPGSTPRLVDGEAPDAASMRLALELGPELGIGGDRALWWGGVARVGFPIGDWLGGWVPRLAVRLAHSRDQLDAATSPAARTGADLLLGVGLPFELGILILRPGISAGAGLLTTVRSDVAPEGSCLTCAVTPVVPDKLVHSTFGLRVEARLGVEVALSDELHVELGLGATVAPMAQTDPIEPMYAAGLPAVDRRRLSVTGEPAWVARAGLTVGWERR